MIKIMYYIPFIIYASFYGLIFLVDTENLNILSVCISLFLYYISGYLLSKDLSLAGLFGALNGLYYIYFSKMATHQIFDYSLIGYEIIFYYLCCSLFVLYTNKKVKKELS